MYRRCIQYAKALYGALGPAATIFTVLSGFLEYHGPWLYMLVHVVVEKAKLTY